MNKTMSPDDRSPGKTAATNLSNTEEVAAQTATNFTVSAVINRLGSHERIRNGSADHQGMSSQVSLNRNDQIYDVSQLQKLMIPSCNWVPNNSWNDDWWVAKMAIGRGQTEAENRSQRIVSNFAPNEKCIRNMNCVALFNAKITQLRQVCCPKTSRTLSPSTSKTWIKSCRSRNRFNWTASYKTQVQFKSRLPSLSKTHRDSLAKTSFRYWMNTVKIARKKAS